MGTYTFFCTWGVHLYSFTTHNMKTACFIVLALVAVSQANMLGGWNEMDCGKKSMCEKRFNKFLVPKIKAHLEDKHSSTKCDWKFCHVESGKYQMVNGVNAEITGYVKCTVKFHKLGKQLKSIDFDCENKPMSEMQM